MSSILLTLKSELIGSWSSSMATLCYFLVLDIILGLMTATLSKNSTKTRSGDVSIKAFMQGLCKKVGILLVIILAHRIDVEIKQVIPSFSSVKTLTIWFFIVDESLSIIENLSLLGIRVPGKIVNILDILHYKLDEENERGPIEVKALDLDDLPDESIKK